MNNNNLSAKEESERKLRDKCYTAGLNAQDIELCVDYLINKLSHKEISQKYNIAYQTSVNKIYNFKKRGIE